MLAAHDAVITNSRKIQQKLVKLVNQCRHSAHNASIDHLPETARPPGRPAERERNQGLAQGSIQEPARGRSHRMSSGAANGLAPCHNRIIIRRNLGGASWGLNTWQ